MSVHSVGADIDGSSPDWGSEICGRVARRLGDDVERVGLVAATLESHLSLAGLSAAGGPAEAIGAKTRPPAPGVLPRKALDQGCARD
jgi:hypothetical protein